MIFKKMKTTNFRQFKGNVELNFSTDSKKNVTILLGNNGSGKTTLLQAFNWCLYNQVNLDNPTELINKEILNEINIGEVAKVEVSVEFEHLKKLFICRKYIDYIRNTEGNIKELNGEQIFTVKDPITGETRRADQNTIREIFPKDLSTYFLFDGERMQNLADNQRRGKKDLSNAVKNLMGLDVLEKAKYHLEKAKREFETEFVSDTSNRINQINEELRSLDENIEREKANKEKYENELEILEYKQSEVNELLKASTVLRELQEKRVEYARQLNNLDSKIATQKNDIFTIFGKSSPNYLLGKTLSIVSNKISISKLGDKGIEGINGSAIDHILSLGKCICGCDLNSNLDAKINLEELKNYLPPESFATLLKVLQNNIRNAFENNESVYSNFNKMYENYNKLLNEKDGLINASNENDKLIADLGDQDLSKYNEEYIELRNFIASKNQAIGSCKNQIENFIEQQKNRETERSNITVNNSVNEIVQCKVDVCQKLIEDIDNRLTEKEEKVKKELQTKTSELFSKMLNSRKNIEIADDYNFSVSDEFHTTTLSEGEKIVTSFAFVGAIISVAKNIIEKDVDSKFESEDSKFTLVMDAPFAKLDSIHRKKVTENIPNLTDQIILFSADSQWDKDVRESLIDKVGFMYDIKNIKSGLSTIEKRDVIC